MTTRERRPHTKSGHDRPPGNGNEKEDNASGISLKRIFIRMGLAVVTMVIVYFAMEDESENVALAKVSETLETKRVMNVECSKEYLKERNLYPGCFPKQCGRVVTDGLVTEEEAAHLLKTAKAGLAYGGSNGGFGHVLMPENQILYKFDYVQASILDLHSGALSKGDKFINIYKILENEKEAVFSEKDFQIYSNVKNRIHHTIAQHFQIPKSKLFLTSPTFFSQMTTKESKTIHDEYWHVHIDKETYGSFHYTSLLYLTEYGKDFTGGRFVFVDKPKNTTVEPKLGRLSFFTSGAENPHFVEKLESGTRYAITVSFTCDETKAIEDPKYQKKS